MNLRSIISRLFSKPGESRVYVPFRQAGVVVNEDTAMTFAAVWACVSVISRTVAALPWGVYQKTPAGREPVSGSIEWILNNQPNEEMTAFSFREVMMVHALTWGNAYAEISRDLSGRVVALWPISPDRVEVRRDEVSKAIVYRVRGETLTVDLPADKILHIHGMGFDGLVGYSPVRMAARSIGMGIAQDTFGQAFYANGTVIGMNVEMAAGMNPEQIKQAENYYNDTHKGPDKAFRVKVTPAGSKVHAVGMPMTDAQFLESRSFSVTEVCRWYGVPPHKVADLTRSTNNNIEHQGIEFVTDAIAPWAIRLEQEANTKLFSYRAQGRVYTKISMAALMRGDSKAQAEYFQKMLQLGIMTVNEVRALLDLNGIGPDGDQRLVQLNQTTLQYLVENPGAKAAAPAQEEPPKEPEEPEEPVSNIIRDKGLEFWRKTR